MEPDRVAVTLCETVIHCVSFARLPSASTRAISSPSQKIARRSFARAVPGRAENERVSPQSQITCVGPSS